MLLKPELVSNWMDARLVEAPSMVARTSQGEPTSHSLNLRYTNITSADSDFTHYFNYFSCGYKETFIILFRVICMKCY